LQRTANYLKFFFFTCSDLSTWRKNGDSGPGKAWTYGRTQLSSGNQRENIFQNGDLSSQKGEMSQSTSLKIPFEDKQTEVSGLCNAREFQDTVILGRTSPGQSPYQCTVCSRSFSCSSDLFLHQRTHATKRLTSACSVGRASATSQLWPGTRQYTAGSAYLSVQTVVTVSYAVPVSFSTGRLRKGRCLLCAHNVVGISVVFLCWWLTWDFTCEFIVVPCASANWNHRHKEEAIPKKKRQPVIQRAWFEY